jgi:hypothetical protein
MHGKLDADLPGAFEWTRMARPIGVLLLALLVGGCSNLVVAPGGSDIPTRTGKPEALDRIHQQAHDALVRWADAVRENGGAAITFTGALTSQLGEWEPALAENNTLALASGAVLPSQPLPAERPGKREVKWVDGTKLDAEILSASAALQDLIEAADEPCDACDPLIVTEANLATGLVETSTGPADVPMWVYAVQGSAVRITRVAVDKGVTIDPPPWNASDPPEGISITQAIGKPDARTIWVWFLGRSDGVDKPCGAEYKAETVESELAIVVIVDENLNTEGVDACDVEGRSRTTEVRLDGALGERAVLEVRQGLPVPVLPT